MARSIARVGQGCDPRETRGRAVDWMQEIDGYCERLGPGYWAEPVNAVTNLAFLLAAAVMAWRLRGARLGLAWALVVLLALIGIGSFLFHTHARAWAALADVAPIMAFALLYLYAANRAFWGLGRGWSLLGVAAFFPFAALVVPLARPLLGGSAAYAPLVLLIACYAAALWPRAPRLARGLALGAALLALSIAARSLDAALCPRWPVGTHFAWHLLNALMLGWMIEVYRRHGLAPRPARR